MERQAHLCEMAVEVNMSAGSIEATIHNKLKSRKVNAM
jgi:hypothetical protein